MIKPGKVIPANTPDKWVFTIVNEHGKEFIIRDNEWNSCWLCKQAMRDYVRNHNTMLLN